MSKLASAVDPCPGKQAWPELVGVKASLAKKIIELENQFVKGRIIKCGAPRTRDFRCDRVFIDVTKVSDACDEEEIAKGVLEDEVKQNE